MHFRMTQLLQPGCTQPKVESLHEMHLSGNVARSMSPAEIHFTVKIGCSYVSNLKRLQRFGGKDLFGFKRALGNGLVPIFETTS
jgi:hypothetical protein